jgi:hypothetical protein
MVLPHTGNEVRSLDCGSAVLQWRKEYSVYGYGFAVLAILVDDSGAAETCIGRV